jgi:hypothetical protein
VRQRGLTSTCRAKIGGCIGPIAASRVASSFSQTTTNPGRHFLATVLSEAFAKLLSIVRPLLSPHANLKIRRLENKTHSMTHNSSTS